MDGGGGVVAAIGDDKRQSILVGRGAAHVLKRLPVWLLFNARLDECRKHRLLLCKIDWHDWRE